ncbi:hypothetical protein JF66_09910 [Cryobacterium sp. MLB-32]|uniref:hypothetical protein n=1 Tax=Cryobacterium sp. MLB-32 TaxID=1529318 RepID=UPI0004E6A54F|nr:hypothetical protein [Cryobacterium sp. MLB-32]KFF59641.1 hypothetical protein JF66_09910 [Cryobacterium sp. MLB-32]
MSDTEHISGPQDPQIEAPQSDDTQSRELPDPTEKAILPPDRDAERAARHRERDTRLRILRGKSDLAHSAVHAIAALHLDGDQLEGLLSEATPTEAERIRISEHRISMRLTEARALAEAAEAAYEQAAMQEFDDDTV